MTEGGGMLDLQGLPDTWHCWSSDVKHSSLSSRYLKARYLSDQVEDSGHTQGRRSEEGGTVGRQHKVSPEEIVAGYLSELRRDPEGQPRPLPPLPWDQVPML